MTTLTCFFNGNVNSGITTSFKGKVIEKLVSQTHLIIFFQQI